MANPNIVNVSAMYGTTTYLTPSSTSAVVLLANTAASGTVMRINEICAANIHATQAVNVTVSIYTNGAVVQGSAPSGGTAYPICSITPVPVNVTLVAVDKTTPIYLQEGTSISVTSGTASSVAYTVSYELIS